MTRVPRRLLATDEHVLLATHQHGRRLLLPALVLIVVSPLTTFAVASVEWPVVRWWLLLAIGVLVVLRYVVRPFLRWLSTTYVLTDRRLLVRGGIVSRWGRDLPLSWVTDVTYRHGLLGRLVGSGTLVVDTAGDGGRLVLPDVPRPAEVQREILRAAELADDRRHATRH